MRRKGLGTRLPGRYRTASVQYSTYTGGRGTACDLGAVRCGAVRYGDVRYLRRSHAGACDRKGGADKRGRVFLRAISH